MTITTFRNTKLSRLVMALASGLMVGFSLPPWGWWPLSICGLIVFFQLAKSVNGSLELFLIGFVFAFAWLALGMGWMWFLSAPGYIIATLLFASLHGVAEVVASRFNTPIFSRPVAHTLAEALRFSFPFGGVPLATLPIAISPTRLADIVAVGGPILASWFVLQTAALVVGYFNKRQSRQPVAIVLLVLIALQIFGQISSPVQTTDKTLRIALVQGGGPQGVLAINSRARDSFDRHLEVTKTLRLSDKPEIVIWPENVIDVVDFASSREYSEIATEAKRLNAEFVVGITEEAGIGHFTNAQVVIQPNGDITSRYDKVRRVPFGEYVPSGLRSLLTAVGAPTDRIPSDAVQGKEPAVLNLQKTDLAVAISWESFFAGRANSGVESGGTILINPTNGSSYTGTILQTQQLATNSLRARETGRWTLQVATTGFSAVITPTGIITQRVGVGEAKTIIVDVPLTTGRTLYSHLGDELFIILLVLGLIICWSVQRKGTAKING
jgi:apolipoprotein N-acyltransferase